MREEDVLDTEFNERLRSGVRLSIEITEQGLVLGAGARLARTTSDGQGASRLTNKEEQERLFALLSVAQRRPIAANKLYSIAASLNDWERGEKSLAHIRLAQASLPRISDVHDAYRLFLAETLLDRGMRPAALMKALGLDASSLDLIKYDPDQPRVPAGNGCDSGQWTSGDSGAASSNQGEASVTISEVKPKASTAAPVAMADVAVATARAGTLAEGLFAAVEGSEFLAGLAALGTTIGGTGAVAGALFVPYPYSVTSEGSIPGSSDLHYRLDTDTGLLSFSHETAAGTELVALARQGQDGIFFETETGIPVARGVGGSLVFDAVSLADVAEDERAKTQAGVAVRAGVEASTESPQLCPDPGPDVPHGASARAIAHQAQISALNNPERPLPPGLAISLSDPATGRRVVFNDCRESDGAMIEAKGPGYARLLRSRYFSDRVLPYRWRTQAAKQISASGGRNLHWFFAEEVAAARAKDVFRDKGLDRVKVMTVPAVIR